MRGRPVAVWTCNIGDLDNWYRLGYAIKLLKKKHKESNPTGVGLFWCVFYGWLVCFYY